LNDLHDVSTLLSRQEVPFRCLFLWPVARCWPGLASKRQKQIVARKNSHVR